ncbi:hypothetical protein AN477_08370 [Alicyclobacillus ferrooxydans]|uniref:Uncharacterized protein n=1 Tax=Alicyclobacillus ferrooxydans TaxID=471514 RepID=A0A0P9CWC7_9BACL|nr:hypothetical protein AN477_08370 [Alicyclobacillus ferrooxydans]
MGADLGNTFMTLFEGKQLLCKGLIALTISSRESWFLVGMRNLSLIDQTGTVPLTNFVPPSRRR